MAYTPKQINTVLNTIRSVNFWQQREAELLFQTMDPSVLMHFLQLRLKTLKNSVKIQERILAARQLEPSKISIFREDTPIQQLQCQAELLRATISQSTTNEQTTPENTVQRFDVCYTSATDRQTQ